MSYCERNWLKMTLIDAKKKNLSLSQIATNHDITLISHNITYTLCRFFSCCHNNPDPLRHGVVAHPTFAPLD